MILGVVLDNACQFDTAESWDGLERRFDPDARQLVFDDERIALAP